MNIILLLLRSAIITLLLTRSVSAFLSTTSHLKYPHHYTQQHHQLYSSAAAAAMWDPKSQTYTDGIVPSHHTALDIDELLLINNGKLKIFGYGSLCWHPGYDGVLSLAGNIQLDNENNIATEEDTNKQKKQQQQQQRKVTTAPGRAIGYQRCWSQRSADHRGTTTFNGIVCTLLSDEEADNLVSQQHNGIGAQQQQQQQQPTIIDGKAGDELEQQRQQRQPSMTEGLIYTIDEELVEDCLAELDFREKGVSI